MKWDVSIGIPVRNGEDLLENTLKYLVENHGNVREIIVSDNASTDKTPKICKKYAEKYPIIKYIRQETYLSQFENWKEALKPARGKYFIWIGHHDLINDNYFSETIPLLEADGFAVTVAPSTYGYYSPSNKSDTVNFLNPVKCGIDSKEKRDRVYAVLTNPTLCHIINQIFRTDFLRRLVDDIFLKEYLSIDIIFPLYASMLGKVLVSPKAAYYYWLRKPETLEQETKRIAKNTNLPELPNNYKRYVPRLFWEICKKYAAELSDDLLKTDIDFAFCHIYNLYTSDDDWYARQISNQPKEKAPEFRAYSAIHIALKDEKVCAFYRNLRYGKKSPFEQTAKEIAHNSYMRMLQILIDEKFIQPQYRLTAEETKMLNELLLLKSNAETT